MSTAERDTLATERILALAEHFYEQLERGEVPSLELPTRVKTNIEFDEHSDVWVYGSGVSVRSFKSVRGAKSLLKLAYTMALLVDEHLKHGRSSTLRELYYISEGWGSLAKFTEQPESDRLVEDIEILTGLQREFFHMRPEEDGASMYGPLKVREATRRGMRDIHCQDDVGEVGYQIPFDADRLQFLECDARFVLAIETGGMYARLIENGFDEQYDALIVHLKGQPARSTRRLLRRLNDELKLPIVVFTDGDPWSYRIYASIAYGAIKSAHLSEYMATPSAMFLGVQPEDIGRYELPTDRLTEQDIRALRSELSDPRFDTPYWKRQLSIQLEENRKAEQQAFAKRGLEYVSTEYLPQRLSEMGVL
ncbi:MAG: DNA topoisomerase IV subunit A [Methermicoccaceae archaeon]